MWWRCKNGKVESKRGVPSGQVDIVDFSFNLDFLYYLIQVCCLSSLELDMLLVKLINAIDQYKLINKIEGNIFVSLKINTPNFVWS